MFIQYVNNCKNGPRMNRPATIHAFYTSPQKRKGERADRGHNCNFYRTEHFLTGGGATGKIAVVSV